MLRREDFWRFLMKNDKRFERIFDKNQLANMLGNYEFQKKIVLNVITNQMYYFHT